MKRSFLRDRRGAAAIEFAVAGVLFLMLLFGTVESAYLYIAQNDLDNAVRSFARGLQTNVTRAAAASNLTTFSVQGFCGDTIVIDCHAVTFTISPISPNYYNAIVVNPVVPTTPDVGVTDDLMLVKAYYPTNLTWPLNVLQLVGTAAYQNE